MNSINDKYDLIMMPHKDYHAEAMYNIYKEMQGHGISIGFLQPVERHQDQRAEEVINSYELEMIPNELFIGNQMNPKAVVVMNDWDQASSHMLKYCRAKNIKIIAIQEGICDFHRRNWSHPVYQDFKRLPYRQSDFILLASDFDAEYFPYTEHKVIGMDRVENLFKLPVKFPFKKKVLVNLNFSYKVCTEYSRQWLEDIATTCDILGLDYEITRHPVDETDVSGFEHKISSRSLHELISECSMFISRFSNAIYESLAMGKPVIYYNPHEENSRVFNEPMDAFLVARDKDNLRECIQMQLFEHNVRTRAHDFLQYHLSIDPEKSSASRSADAICEYIGNLERASVTASNKLANKPAVSIIVPVYNVELYIEECLDSLLRQTLRNIEIIIVNDVSTDKSMEIVKTYAKKDNRIKYYSLDTNSGLSVVRNFGINKSTGESILFVDADDWIKPETCEELYFIMKTNNADVVPFNYISYIQGEIAKDTFVKTNEFNSPDFKKEIFCRNCSPCSKMYNAAFIKENNILFPEHVIFEDWFWTIQWVSSPIKIHSTDKGFYYYRRLRPNSITNKLRDPLHEIESIINNMEHSRRFLMSTGRDMIYYYELVNKSHLRHRFYDKIEDKDIIYSNIVAYLRWVFPNGLPDGVRNSEIKDLYCNYGK